MPVLTRKQYKAEKVFAPSPASPIRVVESPVTVSQEAVTVSSRYEYLLAYPEIPANGVRPSFDGVTVCDGIEKRYRVENGVVRTTDKSLCDTLIFKQQFILLDTKEISNEIH